MSGSPPLFSAFVIYPLVSMMIFTLFGPWLNHLFPLDEDPNYKRDKIYYFPGTYIEMNPRKMGALFFRAILFGFIFRFVLQYTS